MMQESEPAGEVLDDAILEAEVSNPVIEESTPAQEDGQVGEEGEANLEEEVDQEGEQEETEDNSQEQDEVGTSGQGAEPAAEDESESEGETGEEESDEETVRPRTSSRVRFARKILSYDKPGGVQVMVEVQR